MKHLLLPGSAALILAMAATSAIHPSGTPKHQDSSRPILEGASIDSNARHIFERSCANCHSEKTAWPWYSYVAPTSWLVEKDVAVAREHMNLSRWASYSPERKQELLAQIGAMTRGRLMPPPQYLLIHPEAKLSEVELTLLYKWEQTERKRSRISE